MKLHKEYAFSLTELLIVLVIIAVLFAALAPIITKRRSNVTVSNESVWNYVTDDDQLDSFYDPGVPGLTSTAYIGVNPNLISNVSPIAKVVIKAGEVTANGTKVPQRQIQFRYGTGNGAGIDAGSVFFDDKANLMMAADNNTFVNARSSMGNTIAGRGAFQSMKQANYSIAYGPFALSGNANKPYLSPNDNIIAVGNIAGRNLKASSIGMDNVFVGSGSGRSDSYPTHNVAVGTNAMGSEKYPANNTVALGYDTGGGQDQRGLNSQTPINIDSVLVGSAYSGKITPYDYPRYNTIVGYYSYPFGNPQVRYLTSIGYRACDSIGEGAVNNGARTCIGNDTAMGQNNTPASFSKDNYDHIFLGGPPQGGFAGRSVLEVHNQKANVSGNKDNPKFSPTVVMNSNLVIRGNLYVPYDNGRITSFRFAEVERAIWELTQAGDHCKRWAGLFGRRKWRSGLGFRRKDPYTRSFLEFRQYCVGTTNTYTEYNLSTQCPNLHVSDLRLKENISSNDYGLDYILKLKPYNFTFKSDKTNAPQVGVMAQDLQKVFPTAVNKADDGYLRIRWDEMFFAAINAIKTLDSKLEKIASDLSDIESDIKSISHSHKNIQKQIAALNLRAMQLERK